MKKKKKLKSWVLLGGGPNSNGFSNTQRHWILVEIGLKAIGSCCSDLATLLIYKQKRQRRRRRHPPNKPYNVVNNKAGPKRYWYFLEVFCAWLVNQTQQCWVWLLKPDPAVLISPMLLHYSHLNGKSQMDHASDCNSWLKTQERNAPRVL